MKNVHAVSKNRLYFRDDTEKLMFSTDFQILNWEIKYLIPSEVKDWFYNHHYDIYFIMIFRLKQLPNTFMW